MDNLKDNSSILSKTLRVAVFSVLGLSAAFLWFRGLLPSLENRTVSTAYQDTDATRLGRMVSPLARAHPGKSGIVSLPDPRNAFAVRALLAQAAERSLDVQYYIWHKDMSGTLLFKDLWEAAERGVRVRLLLDDNNTAGLDATLAALDLHPNMEIRLFNPLVVRKPRAVNYLFDFFRLNRRMHNKSFTADNQTTVIGGRNMGDDYFGATEGLLFSDLDVMGSGPIAKDVSTDFDRYWASDSAYPVDRLLPRATTADVEEFLADARRMENKTKSLAYTNALRRSDFAKAFVKGKLPLEWVKTRMVSDDPKKGLGKAAPETLFPEKLKAILGEPESKVDLVSPYLVLTTSSQLFVEMAERGVKIRVLTNSLEATDVAYVHAGYTKRRKLLLKAGIVLYELRRAAPNFGGSGSGGRRRSSGSSHSSLHAKTFSVDRARVFIGSFNFDPRSAKLNTELGFIIDSPTMAKKIDTTFDHNVPENAYEVQLVDNKLVWIERRKGEVVLHTKEPGTTAWKRALVLFLSVLPIEWLL